MGKGVVAVSNLEAVAEYGTSDFRAVVIDARRGEIYGAVYDGKGNQIVPEAVMSLQRFLTLIPEGCPIVQAPRELAGAIARIALRSKAQDPAAIEANYVRRSDAEILWKES